MMSFEQKKLDGLDGTHSVIQYTNKITSFKAKRANIKS